MKERTEKLLGEIENFLIDSRAVLGLLKLGSTTGLEKIALYHNAEDGIPAVRALGELKALDALETVATAQKDKAIACAAVMEIGRCARVDKEDSTEPYSAAIYKLGRLWEGANLFEVKTAALLELTNLACRSDGLGKAAEMELKRINVEGGPTLESLEEKAIHENDPKVACIAVTEICKLTRYDGEYMDRPRSLGISKLGSVARCAVTSEAREEATKALRGFADRGDYLGEVARTELKGLDADAGGSDKGSTPVVDVLKVEAEINERPKRKDGEYETNAHDGWNKDGRLCKLVNDIEALAVDLV